MSESVQTFDNDSHEIPIILPPLAIVVSSLSSPTGDVGARVELTMSCRRNMQRNNCETHTVFNSALKSLSKRSHNFNHQQYFNELRIIWGKIGFLIAIPLLHASNVFSAKILLHLLRLVNFKSYLKKGLSFTVLLLNENLMNYFVKIL